MCSSLQSITSANETMSRDYGVLASGWEEDSMLKQREILFTGRRDFDFSEEELLRAWLKLVGLAEHKATLPKLGISEHEATLPKLQAKIQNAATNVSPYEPIGGATEYPMFPMSFYQQDPVTRKQVREVIADRQYIGFLEIHALQQRGYDEMNMYDAAKREIEKKKETLRTVKPGSAQEALLQKENMDALIKQEDVVKSRPTTMEEALAKKKAVEAMVKEFEGEAD